MHELASIHDKLNQHFELIVRMLGNSGGSYNFLPLKQSIVLLSFVVLGYPFAKYIALVGLKIVFWSLDLINSIFLEIDYAIYLTGKKRRPRSEKVASYSTAQSDTKIFEVNQDFGELYATLNLIPPVTLKEVQEAFRREIKMVHPDLLRDASVERIAEATTRTRKVTGAYRALSEQIEHSC